MDFLASRAASEERTPKAGYTYVIRKQLQAVVTMEKNTSHRFTTRPSAVYHGK